jgi:alcohol dehydrogenase YqhD (iron-dependent ADH family)
MENFIFQNATRIVFGKGTEAQVGKETAAHSRKVLLHYGSGSIKKSGLYDAVCKSLTEAGVKWVDLPGVVPNPRLSLVQEGIRICRKEKIDFILAVGGGSVIDSAKAIGIGVPYSGDVWEFYTRKATVREMLPVGVVLTIPAAGSESSTGSVITREEGDYKRDAGGECMRPKFAIMNPELTFTLPPYQTACGASDIMAHVMERYFTRARGVDFTDRLCEATLKTIIHNAPIVLEHPRDYDARAEIMWAGTIAHNDLVGTGRISDWATHMIEHELSGIYDVAHGAGLAVLFPAWMRHVCAEDIRRFAQFAVRVWGVEEDFASPERTAMEGIRRLASFFKDIGLPTTLKELGVKDDRLEEMSKKCVDRGIIGNFVRLDAAGVQKVLTLAR